jgi:hypothetical protein
MYADEHIPINNEVDMDINQDQGDQPDMSKSSIIYCEQMTDHLQNSDEASPSEDEVQALAALHCPQGKLF